jgi:hypothetical protein
LLACMKALPLSIGEMSKNHMHRVLAAWAYRDMTSFYNCQVVLGSTSSSFGIITFSFFPLQKPSADSNFSRLLTCGLIFFQK